MRWSIEYSDGSDFISQYAIERNEEDLIIPKEEEKSSFSGKNLLANRIYICILCILYTLSLLPDMSTLTPHTYPLFESVPA